MIISSLPLFFVLSPLVCPLQWIFPPVSCLHTDTTSGAKLGVNLGKVDFSLFRSEPFPRFILSSINDSPPGSHGKKHEITGGEPQRATPPVLFLYGYIRLKGCQSSFYTSDSVSDGTRWPYCPKPYPCIGGYSDFCLYNYVLVIPHLFAI